MEEVLVEDSADSGKTNFKLKHEDGWISRSR